MASSGDVEEDMSPRLLPLMVGAPSNRHKDRDFDIKLSRMSLGHTDSKQSLLAYTEHVHRINHARQADPSQLSVRAHHVPKVTGSLTSRYRRKAMSLNELIDRRRNTMHERKHSAGSSRSLTKVRVAHLPPKHLRISFVSASDLHDILDYNFSSNGSRSDGLRLSLWESDNSISWMNGEDRGYSLRSHMQGPQQPLPKLPHRTNLPPSSQRLSERDHSFSKQYPNSSTERTLVSENEMTDHDRQRGTGSFALPPISQILASSHSNSAHRPHLSLPTDHFMNPAALRHRPRRAKRMKLHRPELGVIHEGEGSADADVGMRNTRNQTYHFPSRSSFDAIKGSRTKSDIGVQPQWDLESLIDPDMSRNFPSSSSKSDSGNRIHIPTCNSNRSQHSDSDSSSHNRHATTREVVSDTPVQHSSQEKDSVGFNDRKLVMVSKSNKSRANKKMNKLIFLRDFPDKHYHRN